MTFRMLKFAAAAQHLFDAHERRQPFEPLPPELAPSGPAEAYAIQDAFVALRARKLGAVAGYKIALSSAAMQRFVGVDMPMAGMILESTVRRSPARVMAGDYVNLIVEFEIGVEIAADLPAADAPHSREGVARAVGAVMPAIELADDRRADYAALVRHPLDLIADNSWNEGVVLGYPLHEWRSLDLAAARGRASINGSAVGEGVGAAAMGHPLDAVAWIANHLAAIGRGLLREDLVITGSMITSKAVASGDLVRFALEGFGELELRVD
jgi:2-keto-4-pentenoate hydratase